MAALQGIQHVVVLMLENRSFDCMLGKLYPTDGTFEGLTGQETNVYAGGTVPVWKSDAMDALAACIPDPDPGEMFTDMNVQLFGGDGTPNANPPPMSGFVQNYMTQPKSDKPLTATAVMHYFTPDQVPVISTLAKAFGVCDQWYASAPCQTWPNRFFAHTGTCGGYVDNSKFHIPFDQPSIFRSLSDHNRTWRVYFHDVPQSILLRDIWLSAPLNFRLFSQFVVDAANGALPNYSFIEPRYFADLLNTRIPNDSHPPHDVAYGEQLIAAVYNAVRSSPCWKNTLLVITYDEHGGCYDHMPPPLAVPPDASAQDGFAFDRYGVRVPAVLVSPYMPPGSKVRAVPQGLPHAGPARPFDHTSILATLGLLFDLPPLTERDAAAPDLLGPLSLANPVNDGPPSVTANPVQPTPAQVQQHASAAPNYMQDALSQMAARLPVAPPQSAADIPPPSPMTPSPFVTVAQAAANAIARVKAFLGFD
jgi:phospholipase C